MNVNRSLSKIHISLLRELSQPVIDGLRDLGVQGLHLESGRTLQLEQTKGLQKLMAGSLTINEQPASIFTFLVTAEQERPLVHWLVETLGLGRPGRGSVWSKPVTLRSAPDTWVEPRLSIPESPAKVVRTNLAAISCVVQKGAANPVARIGLSTGTAIPLVTFGVGTGLRNRLGAWRILIPAEKEVSTLILDSSEADAVMEMMIDAGQLDQPGKGFILRYPVSSGVLDTRFQIGTVSQAASVEQIVSALDELQGSAEWRRKSISASEQTKKRKYLSAMVNLTLVCNEGAGETFTQVAMAAGAGGATFRRLKYLTLRDQATSVSPAREISEMTVSQAMVEPIAAALDEAGLHTSEHCGEVHLNPVPKACTYLG